MRRPLPITVALVSTDKFQDMCLKSDDERYIRSMIENPISIVLLGNRPCVKARIANYILGYELLPVSGAAVPAALPYAP